MDTNALIKQYYMLENAVMISPHGLRKKMSAGAQDFVLVDVRSALEYRRAHIIGAKNVPVYADPNTPVYEEESRIVQAFREFPEDKQLIVYCYSKACMSGKKVGKMLAESGIFAKHLGIGWNEWRYRWEDWNHEHEWRENSVFDFIEGEDIDGDASNFDDSTIQCAC